MGNKLKSDEYRIKGEEIEKRSKTNDEKLTSVQELNESQQVPTSTNHPSISVESTTIPIIKRRKLTSKDIRMSHSFFFINIDVFPFSTR